MKTIIIPEHTITGTNDSKVGIDWFLYWLINTDREFNVDGVSIRAAMRVEKAIKRAFDPESQVNCIELEEQDYDRLKRAAENPSQGGYPATPARAVLPWVDAIAAAM